MLRALVITLLMICTVAAALPVAEQAYWHKRPAAGQSQRRVRHSRAWWRRHRKLLRAARHGRTARTPARTRRTGARICSEERPGPTGSRRARVADARAPAARAVRVLGPTLAGHADAGRRGHSSAPAARHPRARAAAQGGRAAVAERVAHLVCQRRWRDAFQRARRRRAQCRRGHMARAFPRLSLRRICRRARRRSAACPSPICAAR